MSGFGSGGFGSGAFGGSSALPALPAGAEWSHIAPDGERVKLFRRSNEQSQGYREGAEWFVYETNDRGQERAWQLAPGAVLAWAPFD